MNTKSVEGRYFVFISEEPLINQYECGQIGKSLQQAKEVIDFMQIDNFMEGGEEIKS